MSVEKAAIRMTMMTERLLETLAGTDATPAPARMPPLQRLFASGLLHAWVAPSGIVIFDDEDESPRRWSRDDDDDEDDEIPLLP